MGWAGCPTARYQNWSDFTTLLAPASQDGAMRSQETFLGAELRSRWRQRGSGGPGPPRCRPPSLQPSLPSLLPSFSPCAVPSAQIKGLLLFVRRRWSRSRTTSQGGLLGSPFRSRGRTLFKKLQLILLVTSGCARVVRFESPVYGRNGANPHVGAALMIV